MWKWFAGVVGSIIAGLVVHYLTEGIDQRAVTSTPEITQPAPTTSPRINLESEPEINIPILTIGTSESQIVNTLGQPTLEISALLPNGQKLIYVRNLIYEDVIPDKVNSSYYLDNIGKIRQINIIFNQSVSLGAMQQTFTKMLGGESSLAILGIKYQLRQVYLRQTNLSSFEYNSLKGLFKRDSKDRIFISVWERGFQ